MEEHIISMIKDLEDKDIKKIFLNLSKYIDSKIESYHKELFGNIVDNKKFPSIYTQLVKRDKLEQISDSFIPIVKPINNFDWVENYKTLYYSDGEFEPIGSFIYTQVYFMGSFRELLDLTQSKTYNGILKLKSGKNIKFKYRLMLSSDFHEKEELLYKISQAYKIEYFTPLSPYIRRLLNIVVTDIYSLDSEINQLKDCEAIFPDLKEDKYNFELYPVWNIKFNEIPFQGSERLCREKSIKEYNFPYKKDVFYYNRDINILEYTIDRNILKIKTDNIEPISNWIEISFLSPSLLDKDLTLLESYLKNSILETISSFRPRTKLEIYNLINSIYLGRNIEIESIATLEDTKDIQLDNRYFSYNSFIKDEFIPYRKRYQKFIKLKLKMDSFSNIEDDIKYYIKHLLKYYYPEIIWIVK